MRSGRGSRREENYEDVMMGDRRIDHDGTRFFFCDADTS
jgi:hypothetical protein